MVKITRAHYAALYGPTTGDAVRLGDTSLLAEIEHDYAVPGDECLHGGGKTLRDGIGLVRAHLAGQLDQVLAAGQRGVGPDHGISRKCAIIRAR